MSHKRTSKGFAILGHILRGRARAMKRNPNGIIEITIDEAESLLCSYKSLKEDYLNSLKLLNERNIKHDLFDIKSMAERPSSLEKVVKDKTNKQSKVKKVEPAISSQWAHVLKRLNEQV